MLRFSRDFWTRGFRVMDHRGHSEHFVKDIITDDYHGDKGTLITHNLWGDPVITFDSCIGEMFMFGIAGTVFFAIAIVTCIIAFIHSFFQMIIPMFLIAVSPLIAYVLSLGRSNTGYIFFKNAIRIAALNWITAIMVGVRTDLIMKDYTFSPIWTALAMGTLIICMGITCLEEGDFELPVAFLGGPYLICAVLSPLTVLAEDKASMTVYGVALVIGGMGVIITVLTILFTMIKNLIKNIRDKWRE